MSDTKNRTFIDKCLSGDIRCDDIDLYIESWHTSDTDRSIYDYLGMTREEYNAWVLDPDTLPYIITAHQEDTPLSIILERRI